jgi:hypothetical protein
MKSAKSNVENASTAINSVNRKANLSDSTFESSLAITKSKFASSSNNPSKLSQQVVEKEPFRFGRYVKSSSSSTSNSLAEDYQRSLSNNTKPKKLKRMELNNSKNRSSKLYVLNEESIQKYQEEFEEQNVKSEQVAKENEETESNLNEELDNLSFSSDDTVDLINEAKNYYLENEDEVENRRILESETKYRSVKPFNSLTSANMSRTNTTSLSRMTNRSELSSDTEADEDDESRRKTTTGLLILLAFFTFFSLHFSNKNLKYRKQSILIIFLNTFNRREAQRLYMQRHIFGTM